MRATTDNYISVYDVLRTYELDKPADVIWQELANLDPQLNQKVISKQFLINNGTKTIPHSTPCIPTSELYLIVSAYANWKEKKNPSNTPKFQVIKESPLYKIANLKFFSKEELQKHLQGILRETKEGDYLTGDNLIFMIDLLSRHQLAQQDCKDGLIGIQVVKFPGNRYKNFMLVTPKKKQTISLINYLNPSARSLFKIKLIDKVKA